MRLTNLNRKLYLALPISREAALELFEVFPFFGEFLDIWIQRNYPVSKCTREEIACLPEFTKEQEVALDSLFRPWEEPISTWYATRTEK